MKVSTHNFSYYDSQPAILRRAGLSRSNRRAGRKSRIEVKNWFIWSAAIYRRFNRGSRELIPGSESDNELSHSTYENSLL